MKLFNLTNDSKIYTSNVYLITGTRNAIEDVNTLIDVGRDPLTIERINHASTGVGKKRIEQVILTHSHYDHVSLMPQIRQNFNPKVFAFSPSLKGVDHLLKDGDMMKFGDRMFEIIYTPGHSNDSVCLYCEEEHILFAGDTTVVIMSNQYSYEKSFVHALEKLCKRDIRTIYFGHGEPRREKCNEMLRMSLENVRESKIR